MKMMRFLPLALLGVAVSAAPATAQSFGNAVSIAGDQVLVGEPTQEMRSGAVYVFSQNGSGEWERAQRLEPADGQAGNRFGIRTAVEGDLLLVSATRDDAGAGAVYAFSRSGDTWNEAGRLVTDDRSPADSLGSGLAVDGDWIMVGSIAQGARRGAVYAFRRDGNDWVQHQKLDLPADNAEGDMFGGTIALNGEWALIAAGSKAEGAGAVYAYRWDGDSNSWQPRGQLQAPGLEAQAGMGSSMVMTDDVALVAAPGFLQGIGTVFEFNLDEDDTWQMASLLTPFQADGNGFGGALSFDGETAWIGASGAANRVGRTYSYSRDGTTGEWISSNKVGPPEALRNGFFGASVAVSGDLAVGISLGADYQAGAGYVFERSMGSWDAAGRIEGEVLGMEAVVDGDEVTCSEDGNAVVFGCESVDLVSFLPVSEMGAGRGIRTNDVWGWTDPETGQEIVLVGMTDQMTFVDITNAASPKYLARLPMPEEANGSSWRDMKVYNNHVYVVSDGAGNHGMQVFDLTRLRGLDGTDPPTFMHDALYTGIASAHNIVINEESGFGYAVGVSGGGETCGGGLHMIDLRSPKDPTFAGCFQDTSTGRQRTGYSHDAQCIMYRGPDADHAGKEICFGSNETALSIADVTDKSDPQALSMASYPNVGYSHQGWVSEDHAWFFMNDELDEIGGGVSSTRTLVWDISDLDDPVLAKEHFSENRSSDHNLYVLGNTMYQSNYVSGLRVLDVSDPANPVQTGFFDTVPYGEDVPGFNGSWSNYPYFESGVVVVTSGSEGLFVVKYRPRTIS